MRLTIINFKCIEHKELNFPDRGTVLLEGDNGTGKSTTCKAIEWCLHGGKTKTKNQNSVEKFGKTSVIIETSKLKIFRGKEPERLVVTYEEKEYLDHAGQSILDRIYGPKAVWQSCSYIKQKRVHLLISGTSSDKHKLIYDLTFGESDQDNNPDFFEDKIKRKIKVCSDIQTKHLSMIEHHEKILSKYETDHPDAFVLSKSKTLDVIKAEAESSAKSLAINIKMLNMTREQYIFSTKRLAKRDTLLQELTSLENEMLNLSSLLSNEDIECMEEELEVIIKQSEIIRNIQKINANIVKLSISEEDAKLADENEDFINTYFKESEINDKELNELKSFIEKSLKIDDEISSYNKEVKLIDESIKAENISIDMHNQKVETKIANIKHHNTLVEVYNMKSDRWNRYIESKRVSQSLDPLFDGGKKRICEELASVREKLKELVCPSCGVGLKIDRGCLIKGVTTSDHRRELKNEEAKLIDLLSKYDKYEKMEAICSSLKCEEYTGVVPDPLSILDISIEKKNRVKATYPIKLHGEILTASSKILFEKINNENIPQTNMTLKELSLCLINSKKLFLLKEQLDVLMLDKPTQPLSALVIREGEIRKNIKENNITKEKRCIFNKSITTLKSKINDTPPVTNLEELKNNIEIFEETNEMLLDEKKRIEIINSILIVNKDLDDANNDYISITNKLSYIDIVRKRVERSMSEDMEDVVKSIEEQSNKILQTIYKEESEDPIVIKLNTEKTTKDGKKTKLAIDIKTYHKGVEYTNISDMSGGEETLVSLALTLGMSNTGNSGFVILDEAMNSLSESKVDACIETISNYASEKCIINILHLCNSSAYDKVINLS